MKTLSLALAASLTVAVAAHAQAPAPAAPRPAAVVTKDAKSAPAGDYALDKTHQSVVVRVPHGGGMSFNVFRITDVEGTLKWDPANLAASVVSITAKPASITYPVDGFPAELAGERFFNTAAFPTATFVSKSVKPTGATTGEITGDFTLKGVTKPLTLTTTLIGAGSNMRGVGTLGFHAVGKLKPSDYGVGVGPPTTEIELVIDGEFNKK